MKFYPFEKASRFSYAANSSICLTKDVRSGYEELHRHNYYEVVYVFDGAGVQVINGVAYNVRTGDMVLLHPDDAHSFYAIGTLSQINLCFSSIDDLAHFPPQRPDVPVISLSPSGKIEIESLLYLLENELNRQQLQSDDAAMICLDWILLVLQRHIADQLSYNPLWGKLMLYVAENYATVTLQQAAKIVGVSVSHFCRIFRRDFGSTFHAYVDGVRMQRAKYLLTFSNDTVAHISENVGYGSGPCRFYQDFKKSVGITPNAYRRKTQKELSAPPAFESSIPDIIRESRKE